MRQKYLVDKPFVWPDLATLVGRDFQEIQPRQRFRGPIRLIQRQGLTMTVICWWVGRSIERGPWEAFPDPRFVFRVAPDDVYEHDQIIVIDNGPPMMIMPPGRNLNPALVANLVLPPDFKPARRIRRPRPFNLHSAGMARLRILAGGDID